MIVTLKSDLRKVNPDERLNMKVQKGVKLRAQDKLEGEALPDHHAIIGYWSKRG